MPLTISEEFEDHINGAVTTLAVCCKITRKDGAVIGFTNHMFNLTVDDIVYRAGSGMTPSAAKTNSELTADNIEVRWILNDHQVNEHELIAGLYDGAVLQFFVVNYADLSQGILKGPKGSLGNVKTLDDGTSTVEFRSLIQKTSNTVGELTSTSCRARRLGDARCKFDMDGLTDDGYVTRSQGWVTSITGSRSFESNINNTSDGSYEKSLLYSWESATFDVSLDPQNPYTVAPVSSFDGVRFELVSNPNIKRDIRVGEQGTIQAVRISDSQPFDFDFTIVAVREEANGAWSFVVQSGFFGAAPSDEGTGFPANFFRNGILTWKTGANRGVEQEVMTHVTRLFTLQEPPPYGIELDDEFEVEVGCDRSITMCWQRFDNAINFVGEPYIKPMEHVLEREYDD